MADTKLSALPLKGTVTSDMQVAVAHSGTLYRTPISALVASVPETDPIFTASVAFGITAGDIINWDTAYGWGDHGTQGYAVTTGAETISGLWNFTTAPTIGGTAISLAGHTHVTTDITDLASYTGFDARYYTVTEVDSLIVNMLETSDIGVSVFTQRTITGTTNQIDVANGDGTAGNPVISISVSYAGQTSITIVGTIATGVWQGTAIAAAYGGTGIASYTAGDLLYASAATTLSKLAGVATGNALLSGGVGVAPAWGQIGLTTHVTGTLPVANGGTGATSLTSGYLPKGAGTSAYSASLIYDDGTNICIGTTSATAKLDVVQAYTATQPIAHFRSSGGASATISNDIKVSAFRPGFVLFDQSGGNPSVRLGQDGGTFKISIDTDGDDARDSAAHFDDVIALSINTSGHVDVVTGDLKVGGTTVIDSNRHHQLRSYTVAGLPSAATAAQMIYVSDETGGAVPAFSDGTNWRRVTDRAVVS